jgi:hypothetical protein
MPMVQVDICVTKGGEKYLGMQRPIRRPGYAASLSAKARNLWTQESHANRVQAKSSPGKLVVAPLRKAPRCSAALHSGSETKLVLRVRQGLGAGHSIGFIEPTSGL